MPTKMLKTNVAHGLLLAALTGRFFWPLPICVNPLEQNIRVYHIVKGVRRMLKNYDEIIDVRKRHGLHVINEGRRLQVYYNEKKVFDLCDDTFKEGLIGLWTKSDAVTYFDDLRLKILK